MITHAEANVAKRLVNDAGSFAPLIAIISEIDDATKTLLREAHDKTGYGCNAENEGLWCCIDILLRDPDDFAPEKIQAAEELLARYRSQSPR
jgi:hypothetical protein